MRAVVTGAGGFIGGHLVDALAHNGAAVQAWGRGAPDDKRGAPVDCVTVDICDKAAVLHTLSRFEPDLVFHLAAQTLPVRSWEEPELTYRTNLIGTLHLLDAVRHLARKPRVLIAGSSAEYADAAESPIDETAPIEPNSPYAASKVAAVELARLYGRRYDLDLICFRPFVLAGPRKTGDVYSDFARRIVAIERGQEAAMRVGTLDVVRDILDVRDGVGAVLRIAEAGRRHEVYNVASGRGVSIRDILESYRRLARVPIDVVDDPALRRPLDHRIRIGNPAKLAGLGWKPRHGLDDTLSSILTHWRERAAEPGPADVD